MNPKFRDDGLEIFAKDGPPALPAGGALLDRDGARIWHAHYGAGPAVMLLHGGMGNANNFGHQVPALIEAGFSVVVVDSRGHGRSSWDGGAFSYSQFATDALAVLDRLGIGKVAVVGWSDGACTGLAMAKAAPERIAGVLFFACNVDESGSVPFVFTETIGNCLTRHKKDYAALSPEPERFEEMSQKLQVMQGTQPDYSADDLRSIAVPVIVLQAERDEFISAEHARYIADTVTGARYVWLADVSHFAPVQRPEAFNAEVLDFLRNLTF
ncbi:alpha/beta hydrolase [Devosia soli]|uniref:Alpha/beta hydrolase n=1 Tax=Devosia soli TaxID=361041 RepID=A0A0F5LI28_9HYPH|nr:alpha/beta hydrolase [Devosia soli]KKB81227.1 alpha/beta hydrolase [Devosia soli]